MNVSLRRTGFCIYSPYAGDCDAVENEEAEEGLSAIKHFSAMIGQRQTGDTNGESRPVLPDSLGRLECRDTDFSATGVVVREVLSEKGRKR
jgi:hypothetical protein